MFGLSEIAMRILAELEEEKVENVTSTMNTVLDAKGDTNELSEIKEALKQLVMEDFAIIGYADGETTRFNAASKEQSLEDIAALDRFISYRTADRLWVWDKKASRAEIRVSQSGLSIARKLLEDRGYQWWRSGI